MKRASGPVGFRLARRLTPAPPPITADRLGRPITQPCQLWGGSLIKGGYGMISYGSGRGNKLVHRVAYALAHGLDVDDVPELDHRCRVRHCAEAEHAEPVTHAENIRRGDTGLHNRVKTGCGREAHGPYDLLSGRRRKCSACQREAWQRYDAAHRTERAAAKRAQRANRDQVPNT